MYFKCVNKFSYDYDNYFLLVNSKKFNFPSYISKENKKIVELYIKNKKFEGKESEKLSFTLIENNKPINFTLIGLGDKEKLNSKNTRQYIYTALASETGNTLLSYSDSSLENPDLISDVVEHINYKFDKYLTKKKDKFLTVNFFSEKKFPKVIEGYELAKISNIVKDLINEHSEELTPKELANKAAELGKEFGFEVEIFDEKKIKKFGMDSYLSVARAAFHRPYLIVMRYKGNPKSKYKFGLVGKGLTYDTGGLSLKPSDSMLGMKEDMGGAATMIGVMCAVSKMKIKKNVTCVVAACENSIGPNAYRPGDIIKTMNGKSIEVTNTDAEGRLTLIDALTYIIRKEKVDEIIDAATLTGAIMIALGEDVTGVFSNDDNFAKKFIESSENWFEYFWQMPTFDTYKRYLKSDIADIQNTGSRMGGAVNAAKFLQEFVEDKKWLHLDIAGTAFSNGGNPYFNKKGATGQVFRTIYTYIKNQ